MADFIRRNPVTAGFDAGEQRKSDRLDLQSRRLSHDLAVEGADRDAARDAALAAAVTPQPTQPAQPTNTTAQPVNAGPTVGPVPSSQVPAPAATPPAAQAPQPSLRNRATSELAGRGLGAEAFEMAQSALDADGQVFDSMITQLTAGQPEAALAIMQRAGKTPSSAMQNAFHDARFQKAYKAVWDHNKKVYSGNPRALERAMAQDTARLMGQLAGGQTGQGQAPVNFNNPNRPLPAEPTPETPDYQYVSGPGGTQFYIDPANPGVAVPVNTTGGDQLLDPPKQPTPQDLYETAAQIAAKEVSGAFVTAETRSHVEQRTKEIYQRLMELGGNPTAALAQPAPPPPPEQPGFVSRAFDYFTGGNNAQAASTPPQTGFRAPAVQNQTALPPNFQQSPAPPQQVQGIPLPPELMNELDGTVVADETGRRYVKRGNTLVPQQ